MSRCDSVLKVNGLSTNEKLSTQLSEGKDYDHGVQVFGSFQYEENSKPLNTEKLLRGSFVTDQNSVQTYTSLRKKTINGTPMLGGTGGMGKSHPVMTSLGPDYDIGFPKTAATTASRVEKYIYDAHSLVPIASILKILQFEQYSLRGILNSPSATLAATKYAEFSKTSATLDFQTSYLRTVVHSEQFGVQSFTANTTLQMNLEKNPTINRQMNMLPYLEKQFGTTSDRPLSEMNTTAIPVEVSDYHSTPRLPEDMEISNINISLDEIEKSNHNISNFKKLPFVSDVESQFYLKGIDFCCSYSREVNVSKCIFQPNENDNSMHHTMQIIECILFSNFNRLNSSLWKLDEILNDDSRPQDSAVTFPQTDVGTFTSLPIQLLLAHLQDFEFLLYHISVFAIHQNDAGYDTR